jgi:hypothetical protein
MNGCACKPPDNELRRYQAGFARPCVGASAGRADQGTLGRD